MIPRKKVLVICTEILADFILVIYTEIKDEFPFIYSWSFGIQLILLQPKLPTDMRNSESALRWTTGIRILEKGAREWFFQLLFMKWKQISKSSLA